jgi:hypothetical protein
VKTRVRPDSGQRGSVLVLVLVVIVALLAGGAVLLSLQLGSTRQAGLAADERGALYCAEGGLAAARPVLLANYAGWAQVLDADPGNDPAWYPITADLDGNGLADYEVTLRDNDDESLPAANDPTVDIDLRVFADSRCLIYADSPRTVTELLRYQGGGKLYRNQAAQGSWNSGNSNQE